MTADAQVVALRDLVESDGWKLFKAHMDAAWGAEAMERRLRTLRYGTDDKGTGAVSMEEWPFESTRVLDTFAGMRGILSWPEEQLRTLQGHKAQERTGLARWRRT